MRPVVAKRHKVWLWNQLVVSSNPLEKIKYLFKFVFLFIRSGIEAKPELSSVTQHSMLPEFGGKWITECLNTRFPLPTLLQVRDTACKWAKKINKSNNLQWTKTNFSKYKSSIYKVLYTEARKLICSSDSSFSYLVSI